MSTPAKICPECGVIPGTPILPLRRWSLLRLLPLGCALLVLAVVVWRPLHTERSPFGGMWQNSVTRFPSEDFTVGHLRQLAEGELTPDASLQSILLGPSAQSLNIHATPDDATLRLALGPPSGNRISIQGYGWPVFWINRLEQTPYDNMFTQTGSLPPKRPNTGGVFLVGSAIIVSQGTDSNGRSIDFSLDLAGPASSALIVILSWYFFCAIRWLIRRLHQASSDKPWLDRFPLRAAILIACATVCMGFFRLKPEINYNADTSKLTFHTTDIHYGRLMSEADSSMNPKTNQLLAQSLLEALPADTTPESPIAMSFQMHPGNNIAGTNTMYGVPAWIYAVTQTRKALGTTAPIPFPPAPSHIEFSGWDRVTLFEQVPPGSLSRKFIQMETSIIIQQLFLIYMAWAVPNWCILAFRTLITRRRKRENACTACGYSLS